MDGKRLFDNVVIIGVGLIGGSLGMALLSRGLVGKVTGVDLDPENLSLAVESEAVSEGFPDYKTVIPDADLVVVATPVGFTLEIVKDIVPLVKPGCIITDVGSTKGKIVNEVQKLLPEGVHFIGGHPMTGSEITGAKGADKYLFENAVYVLTPFSTAEREVVSKLRALIESLGAKVVELDADEHDLMVAAVSHLPHLAATALVNTVGEIDKDHEGLLMLAAGGFRDTTRVASGHSLMWKDICISNSNNILEVLEQYISSLINIRSLIEKCDSDGLENGFKKAKKLRENIPSKMRGYLPLVHEIVVTVPDKPGVIGNLAGILGSHDINISDIEILRVREGEGGTIRLALGSEDQKEKAIRVLSEKGISVKKR